MSNEYHSDATHSRQTDANALTTYNGTGMQNLRQTPTSADPPMSNPEDEKTEFIRLSF